MTSDLHHRLSWMSMRLGTSAELVRAQRCGKLLRTHAAHQRKVRHRSAPGPIHTQWHAGAACLRVLAVKPPPKSP